MFLSRVLVIFCVKKVPGIVKYYFFTIKVGPIDVTHKCQHFFQSSKYFLKALYGMGFSSFHEFCFMASIESKRVTRATTVVSRTQIVLPRIWPFLMAFPTQTLQKGQKVFCIDLLSLWNEFVMHQTTNIQENHEHHLDF